MWFSRSVRVRVRVGVRVDRAFDRVAVMRTYMHCITLPLNGNFEKKT